MRSQFILMATALAGVLGLSSCGALLALDTSGGVAVRTTDYNPGYGYGSYRLGYDEARRQALFLSDKMAYELALNEAQFEAVYEINLDYLLNMRGERSIYGDYWVRRNSDMFYVLNPTQYNVFVNYDYFYRPVSWTNNYYSYNIYNYYDNSVYYYNQPVYYDSYRGGRNQLSNSYYAGRFGERTGSPIIINPSDNNYQGSRGYKDYRGGAVERSGSTPSRSFGNSSSTTTAPTRSFESSSSTPSRSTNTNSGSFGGSRQNYDQQRSSSSSTSSSSSSAPTRSFGNSSSAPSRSTSSGSFGGSRQNINSSTQSQPSSSSGSTTAPSRSFSSTQVYN